eukprot:SAG11_NODE_8779_length_977_cov_1.796128_1_plen_271_part_00
MAKEWERWQDAARAGMEALPDRPPKQKWRQIRSEETLDLLDQRAKAMQAGAKQKEDWPERRKQMQQKIRKSCLEDWRTHINKIADDMMEADAAEDLGRMAECVRKLGGGGRGFCTTQPQPSLGAEERAELWAEFGENKFRKTERELEREAIQELGPAASREEDANCRLTDEELNFCAKALKKSKACGMDGIPAETFKEDGPLRKGLYNLIRRIWEEEEVPEDLVCGLFVMIYKGKGSSDDLTKYRCICLLNHAYKLLSAVLLRIDGSDTH